MLVYVPVETWLTLLIEIIPYALDIEGITRIEYVITSKGSYQSTIPLLYLAHLFCQISGVFVLDINIELLEASKLCRPCTLLVAIFPISTSDTMPREQWKLIDQFVVTRLRCLLPSRTFFTNFC